MKRTVSLTPKTPGGPRAGLFMIVAMICLLLTSALLGTLLKMAVLGRQQAELDAYGLQADWLAESALDRALAKLAEQPGYQGETWTIPTEELDGLHRGQVAISLKPAASNGREVEVIARFPAEGSQTVKRTKRLRVAMPSPVVPTKAKSKKPKSSNAKKHVPASAEKMGRRGA